MSELREKIAKLLWDYIGNGDYVAGKVLELIRAEGVDLEGWRPIESIEDVPANTPTLFGAYPEGFELFVQAIVQRTPIQFGTYGLRGWDYTNVKATHWRPLPAPPLSALENPE